MRLHDKVALVTGGGAGLGRSVAERYAREGARVVIAEIDRARGQDVESAIRRQGGEAMFVHVDIGDEEQIRALIQIVREKYQRIDILQNNAAILLHSLECPVHELPVEIWDRTFRVNARGMFLVAKYVLQLMLEQGGGTIVMVGSPTAINGTGAGIPAYSASKGAVHALARAMAIQYAPHKIRVNLVVPGTMDTPMNAAVLNGDTSQFVERIPLGRLGRPEDLGGISVFLASDDSAYCTGGIYMADGGLTAY
jgi:NAD(P)-dependent dehydrogenase (short-subunit alcohol dehydrogenase family)